MALFPVLGPLPWLQHVVGYPATRGPMVPAASCIVAKQRLSTDSIGNCDIRIKNAVTSSRYRIEIASDGTLVVEGTVASQDFNVSVPYYPAGNSNNSLVVKVRKGTSAPKYQPFETQVEAGAAGALAYIAQVPDPIA
jgi:formylmethanofuran dehydrogenase subunit D